MRTRRPPTHTGWHSWLSSLRDPRARCCRTVPTAGRTAFYHETVFKVTTETVVQLCSVRRTPKGALCYHSWACTVSSSSPVCPSGPGGNLHSYARPPPSVPSRAVSPPRGQCRERRRNRVRLTSGFSKCWEFAFKQLDLHQLKYAGCPSYCHFHAWPSEVVGFFHRRAVNAAPPCRPNRRCLTTKTWAGASPGLQLSGTAFSKVDARTDARTLTHALAVDPQLSCRSLPAGTHLRFHCGPNVEWQDVEDLDSAEEDLAEEERSTSLKVRPHMDRQAWSLKVLQSVKPCSTFFFFCRVTAQKACSWWSTLRSSCPGRLSCSWPSTLAYLDTPHWPRAASWITPSTSKTKVWLLGGAKRCAGVPTWRTRLRSVCFPSRLDLLLSQPDRGASWDTVPRTGSGGVVPPSGTQRCQTRRQLVGLRENQEVNETTADTQWKWSEDEAWNIHGFILSSSAMTSLLWTTPPSTCWVVWPGGGGPPSPAVEPFPQTDACQKVLNFKTPNFVNICKNRTDKLRILFYFVSILFSIQSNPIVSICSISNRLLQSQSPRRSSSEDGQNPERQRSCSSRGQQCHTHEVQAANERLHAVCQEISCGIHANVPGQRQQVGVNWVCEKGVMLKPTSYNSQHFAQPALNKAFLYLTRSSLLLCSQSSRWVRLIVLLEQGGFGWDRPAGAKNKCGYKSQNLCEKSLNKAQL